MRTGYSLASMLLLTAVAAIFLAAGRMLMVVQQPVAHNRDPAFAVGFIGIVIAAMLGLDLGTERGQRALGLAGGLGFGVLSTFLLVIPEQYLVVAVGAPILVLFAAVARRGSRRSPRHPRRE